MNSFVFNDPAHSKPEATHLTDQPMYSPYAMTLKIWCINYFKITFLVQLSWSGFWITLNCRFGLFEFRRRYKFLSKADMFLNVWVFTMFSPSRSFCLTHFMILVWYFRRRSKGTNPTMGCLGKEVDKQANWLSWSDANVECWVTDGLMQIQSKESCYRVRWLK